MWAQRLPADASTAASRCAASGDPVLYVQNPARRERSRPPRDARRARRAQPAGRSSGSAIRKRRRASRSTRWRSACRRSVPELTDLAKEPQATLEHVRPGGEEARHVRRTARCWPAGWSSAACASCRSCIAAGTSTATCRSDIDVAVRGHRPGRPPRSLTDLKQRGLLDDTLVVWGGEFGRTVYSQGTLTNDELRPRPSSAQLLHVAGRRRHQGRHRPTARPTTSATTSSRTRSTSTT